MKNNDLYTIYDVVNFLKNCNQKVGVEIIINRDGTEYYNFSIYDTNGEGTLIVEQKSISGLFEYLVNDYFNTLD